MDLSAIREIDQSGYFDILQAFGDQLKDAARLTKNTIRDLETASALPKSDAIEEIVICGMGGSAIAGDLVKSLLTDQLSKPLIVCRDYQLPNFVDHQTLVIVSSYSGNTEETLSALADAKARRALIVTLSTGGSIARIGKSDAFYHIEIPGGLQPRQSIAYSLSLLYGVLRFLFLGDSDLSDLVASAAALQDAKMRFALAPDRDPFIETARQLSHQPVITYASDRHLSVALRFKGQVCENAKLLAFANTVPEMNHNEIVGWEMFRRSTEHRFGVVLFRDSDDHPQTQKRFEIIKTLLRPHAEIVEFWMEGRSLFEKYLSAIHWGDWMSFYMAIARRIDPTPVDTISQLKSELAL